MELDISGMTSEELKELIEAEPFTWMRTLQAMQAERRQASEGELTEAELSEDDFTDDYFDDSRLYGYED